MQNDLFRLCFIKIIANVCLFNVLFFFLTEIRAVVLGWQKSDKDSVINSILGDEVETDKYFVKSVRKESEVNGRKITLINTVCWWDNFGFKRHTRVCQTGTGLQCLPVSTRTSCLSHSH